MDRQNDIPGMLHPCRISPVWFPGELPAGNKLIIGLNPPFGKNGILAAQFAALAAKHRPRLIVLVVPPQTKVTSAAYLKLQAESQDFRTCQSSATIICAAHCNKVMLSPATSHAN